MTDPVTLKINADELIKSALKEDITSEDVSTNAVLKTYVEGDFHLYFPHKRRILLCKFHGFGYSPGRADMVVFKHNRAYGVQRQRYKGKY